MREVKKVLVSGGAGYIGSVLVRILLQRGYFVRVIDNLLYGGESLVELLNNDQFDFVKGDIRNINDLTRSLVDIDYVAHLAAIVGDPACAQQPELARETNLSATINFYHLCNEIGIKRFIFASTCSNYGKMQDPDKYVDENSELVPLSVYAETKVAIELFLLEQNKQNVCKPTCLRFSTVYGLSPRIRFDLTVNEFTKEMALGRELVVFGEQFWRPYTHVEDLARSVVTVLEAPEEKIAFEVYNVGDTSENYKKQMIVNEILKQLPGSKIRYIKKDEDPRDYRVSFNKIKEQLGYKVTRKLPYGIAQIKKIIMDGLLDDPDDIKYRNL
jgi:nucleoside-diphosphate-sugar epimerase